MDPVALRTDRLVLSIPVSGDATAMYEYCQDEAIARLTTIPQPYLPESARVFIDDTVPSRWAEGSEYTWALRPVEAAEQFLGVIGARRGPESDVFALGYWLGEPHRGRGLLSEAGDAVVRWLFEHAGARMLQWEALVGNRPSARVARKLGFLYTGIAPSAVTFRDGGHPECWHAELSPATDHRVVAASWAPLDL